MSLRQLQSYLGHSSIEITVKYLHLTSVSETKAQEALARLFSQVMAGQGGANMEHRTSNLEHPNPEGRQSRSVMEGSHLPANLPANLPQQLPSNLPSQLPPPSPPSRQWKRWKPWKRASRH